MRFLMIAGAATFLLMPVAGPANACSGAKHSAQAASTEYSAEEKKPVKVAVKKIKKPKEKVEYMRAVPMK